MAEDVSRRREKNHYFSLVYSKKIYQNNYMDLIAMQMYTHRIDLTIVMESHGFLNRLFCSNDLLIE